MLSIRTILSALAVASAANAVVYRPANQMARLSPRQNDAKASSSAKMASEAAATNTAPPFKYGSPSTDYPNVVASGDMGKTNPKKAKTGTPVNQDSDSRLASVNSVDDWCTFAPKDSTKELGDVEEEVVVYCTKPRNNARVIPDGTVTAAHFVKTPLYVQIMALGDFTKINIQKGDHGGELDPHGATGQGNPIGGNVTSNVTGKDVSYQEWMNYVGFDNLCFRICYAGADDAKPTDVCNHVFDKVGCRWVMPGDYTPDSFDSCEADAAYPPGVFLQGSSTSTFQQFATGLWTDHGKEKTYTNGKSDQSTPTAAFSMPKSSKCVKAPSISNGIKSIIPTSDAKPSGDGSTGGASSTGGDKNGSSKGGSSGGSKDDSSSNSKGDSSDDSKDDSSSSSNGGSDSDSSNKSSSRDGAATLSASFASLGAIFATIFAGAVLL